MAALLAVVFRKIPPTEWFYSVRRGGGQVTASKVEKSVPNDIITMIIVSQILDARQTA